MEPWVRSFEWHVWRRKKSSRHYPCLMIWRLFSAALSMMTSSPNDNWNKECLDIQGEHQCSISLLLCKAREGDERHYRCSFVQPGCSRHEWIEKWRLVCLAHLFVSRISPPFVRDKIILTIDKIFTRSHWIEDSSCYRPLKERETVFSDSFVRESLHDSWIVDLWVGITFDVSWCEHSWQLFDVDRSFDGSQFEWCPGSSDSWIFIEWMILARIELFEEIISRLPVRDV